MNIAVVTETWTPTINGIALVAARMARALQARGHNIQVFRPHRYRNDTTCEVGMNEYLFEFHPNTASFVQNTLLRLWSSARPDVVCVHTEGPFGWIACRAAHSLKIPIASYYHINYMKYADCYKDNRERSDLLRALTYFHNNADITMVPTENIRRELEPFGFKKLRVVGRGVDTECFNPRHRCDQLRKQWGAQPDTPVLLCVGRLVVEKSPELLLDTWQKIKAHVPTTRLVLVGDGPLRAALNERCPDAIFAGQRTGDDLSRHYASADLFVFPSLTETWGNVVTEAMASGLPVIAWDYASATELIHTGVNGTRVALGDVEGFHSAVLRTITNPEAMRREGKKAREMSCEFGWDKIIEETERELYKLARYIHETN